MSQSQWDKFCTKTIINKWLYNKTNLHGAAQRWLLNRMKKWPKNTTLLDAGCGAGATAFAMKCQNLLGKIKYTGVDSSKLMLAVAKEKVNHPNIRWVCFPLEDFADGTYDRIIIKFVLSHTLHPEFIIKNLAKRLNHTGTMHILFWVNPINGESRIRLNKDNFYVNAHSRQMLMEAIRECDLKIIKEHQLGSPRSKMNWVIRKNKRL